MRRFAALAVLIGLSLAASGCDKRSGEGAQGAGNASGANAAASDNAAPDEVSSDEMPSSGADNAAAGKSFDHVVDRSHKGEAMPDKGFLSLDGKPVTLSALSGGKPMLVNLWATWCAPCVAELPVLDRLAGAAAGKGFAVVAVSQDQEGKTAVPPFWKAHGLTALKTWLDPENVLGFHYGTGTLPTTIVYDAQGKELARIVGALDWQGAEGKALLREIGG